MWKAARHRLGALIGAILAVLSQGIRGRRGRYSWKPRRYWEQVGNPNLAFSDPLLALVLGALVGGRLTWLLVELSSRARRRPVRGRLFYRADIVLLVIPVLWLSYLIYAINFAD